MVYTDPLQPPQSLTCIFSDPGGLKDSTTWTFGFLEVPREKGSIPTRYVLDQNYPNPFNPATTIRFQIPQSSLVRLEIFNLFGQRVTTLVDGYRDVGEYAAVWKPEASSGVYFYRLEAGPFVELRKMLLIK
jgi:hypothetical protein